VKSGKWRMITSRLEKNISFINEIVMYEIKMRLLFGALKGIQFRPKSTV
jgi:hypothetical protein